ncbi:hypothetical protein [Brevibacillus dissolubilis]|uniref:hypothetical protein n=1 Tax=Brevibacillus dissolubilis TaxID=1844116 RepID=UPI001115B3E6|nr:hypothetical protein [Brevibacillus dissolubilis]
MTLLKHSVKESTYRSYQYYAFPVSILVSHMEQNEGVEAWIHSNFIQACFDERLFDGGVPVPFAPYQFDYAFNPWLHTQRLSRELVGMLDLDILSFIVKSLTHGFCLYLNADEFFLPNRQFYQKQNYSHDVLIYGVDTEQERLFLMGYDDNSQYTTFEAGYDEFRQAYQSLDVIENHCNQIYLYRYQPEGSYTFQIHLVLDLIEDYLYSRNTSERLYMVAEPYDRTYGQNTIASVQRYLQLLMEGRIEFDIRIIHYLVEHKEAMLHRLRYLERKKYLDQSLGFADTYAEQVYGQALMYRNMIMKSAIDNNSKRVQSVIGSLDQMRQDEHELLVRMVTHARERAAKPLQEFN